MNTNWQPEADEDENDLTDLDMTVGEIVFGCVCMAAIGVLFVVVFTKAAGWFW